MHGKARRGLDYTPLFRFLHSKVGQDWDSVFSEAKSRLDKSEPIFWLVALREEEQLETIRIGESSYYSGMFVDKYGVLQFVNPNLSGDDLPVQCNCCTHTLNGQVFGRD